MLPNVYFYIIDSCLLGEYLQVLLDKMITLGVG